MRVKHITKEDCLRAMRHTKSNRAAARYLGVSYQHYRKFALLYKNEEGKSLLDIHSNPAGKGIRKFVTDPNKHPHSKQEIAMVDLMEGRIDPSHYTAKRIKTRLINDGILKDECYRCGFHEYRVVDYKIPLVLHFKDKNKRNFGVSNLELLCYNCYFLYVTDLFNTKDLSALEDNLDVTFKTSEHVELELDEYNLQKLKELGLIDDKPNDGSEIISKI